VGAQGLLALCSSGFIPKLIMFLLICFISEVTRGERKHSVSLSQLFYSWLCHKCTQQWVEKKIYKACPKAHVFQWPEGACCVSRERAGANPRGGCSGAAGAEMTAVWLSALVSASSQCPPLFSACRSALQSASTVLWRSAGWLWPHPAKGKLAKLTR